jgi:hypothetical protein
MRRAAWWRWITKVDWGNATMAALYGHCEIAAVPCMEDWPLAAVASMRRFDPQENRASETSIGIEHENCQI